MVYHEPHMIELREVFPRFILVVEIAAPARARHGKCFRQNEPSAQ